LRVFFSSDNMPLVVGLKDAAVVVILSTVAQLISVQMENAATGMHYWLYLGPTIEFEIVVSLVVTVLSAVLTIRVHQQNRVRSIRRTVWSTAMILLGSTLLLGLLIGTLEHQYTAYRFVGILGVVGWVLAPIGYRGMGFVPRKRTGTHDFDPANAQLPA